MKKAYLYILATAVIFSTMELASKTVANEIHPIQLNFYRFFIGALVLLPGAVRAVRKRQLVLNRSDYLFFLFTGFLGIVIGMTLFQFAVLYTMAATVAVIFSANPVFTAPFAYFLLHEQLNKRILLSLAISLLGVLCILNPLGIHGDMKGILLVLLSAVTFALYSVIGKMKADKYGSVVFSCFSFLGGVTILLVVILGSHLPVFPHSIPIISGIGYGNIAALLYLGIVVSGLGFLFYFKGMEKTSAATGSIVFFIKPALAPVFCLLILNEHLSLQTVAGIALILTGAYLTVSDGKKNQANANALQRATF